MSARPASSPGIARLLAHAAWTRLRVRDAEGRRFRLERDRFLLGQRLTSLLGRRPALARAGGFDVEYLDAVEFLHLLDEIFGRDVYAFEAATDAPFVIDAGANIGMSVLYFKRRYPAARVLAFEPLPAAFELLRRNVARNRLAGVELVPAALAEDDGEIDLYAEAEGRLSLRASIDPDRVGTASARRVHAVRLSSHVSEDVDLLKLDVEGAEERVLDELAAAGKLERIREIHLEVHHHLRPGEDRLSRVLGRLETAGFGYQIAAAAPPAARGVFQDVLVHAYRKRDGAAVK